MSRKIARHTVFCLDHSVGVKSVSIVTGIDKDFLISGSKEGDLLFIIVVSEYFLYDNLSPALYANKEFAIFKQF
jgi:hypothetical protein